MLFWRALLVTGFLFSALPSMAAANENLSRRDEAAPHYLTAAIETLEAVRIDFASLGKAAANGDEIFSCPDFKGFRAAFAALGKAADQTGSVGEIFPDDAAALVSGGYTADDIQGLDPCTGKAGADANALGAAVRLTSLRQHFEASLQKLVVGEKSLAGFQDESEGGSGAARCDMAEEKVLKLLDAFEVSYAAVEGLLDDAQADLQAAARRNSSRHCAPPLRQAGRRASWGE